MWLLWNLFELAGTLSFAVSGAIVGMLRHMDIFGISVLAVLTAVGGGILRDLMAQRIPVVLVADVYATASIVGSLVLCLFWRLGAADAAPFAGASVVIALRILALKFKWQLYRPLEPGGGRSRH